MSARMMSEVDSKEKKTEKDSAIDSDKSEKKSSADDYRLWKNRIDAAKRGMETSIKEWKKFERAYEGDVIGGDNSSYKTECQKTNLFYVDVRSFTPKIYSRSPYIYIDPATPEADLTSEILEKVINSQLDDVWKFKSVLRELIKGTKIKGRGYLKTSYKYEGDKIGRQYIGDQPNDEITIDYVDRKDLIIDPNARSISSARWRAHKIIAPIADIRKKFKIDDDEELHVVEENCDENKKNGLSQEERSDFQYGTYYELENNVDHTLAIQVEGLDRWAVPPYKCPYGYNTMYDHFEWNNIPGQQDTKGDLHFWWNDLYELAEIKTLKSHHRRKLISKIIVTGGVPLTDDQKDAFTSDEDSTVIELTAGQSFQPYQHASLGEEIYLYEQLLRQDITMVSGMNEMKQGLPQTTKTAREAMAIVAESADVISDRVGLLEDVIASVIEKCIWLIQHKYDTTKVISLSGMEEVEFLAFKERFGEKALGNAKNPFLNVVGTDLQGKMRVRVKAGSTLPVDENQRKADITQLIALMGQSQQVSAQVDPKELLKEVSKVLHIENKGIIFDSKTPEQENSLLKRNIPVTPQMNEPHDEHLAAHDLENNNTPAFIAHAFTHRLMKSFVERSQLTAMKGQSPNIGMAGPGGLSQENISGMPQGSNVPPESLPTQQTQQSGAAVGGNPQPQGLPAQ